ncbi:hypothetical protein SCBWM1_gp100 [Synechococcus phage S-CBWM1]|uniref:Uncharacterized protein n=1 Tax=Synechococcus phage S-CBWM1 TaxID=2053653 RepID=A0A3G1L3M0_9CAUD|nr:head-tail adaptor [Synechococcus phage S-CBWM1]ATW62784.1 hypothetical protein SCBWM1_gp100 [Synechococcus phage S-CBWM1]
MTAPILKSVSLPLPQILLLEFDIPLAQVATPLSSFTVNHGTVEVVGLSYMSNKIISLSLGTEMKPLDRIFVSYEPPLDINLCLRSVLSPAATDTDKKRNSVRPFSRVDGRNLLLVDPTADGSDENANLGVDTIGDGYPRDDRSSDPRSATVGDFILAYGEREAIQLTNLDDGSAKSVNEAKLRMAIEDANALIDNYIVQAGRAGKFLISSNRRRTALMIARYYLDTVRRREDVYKDYQDCIKELDAVKDGITRAGSPAIETKRGAIRVHRIPQRYNSVTGKGLSGWHTDPDIEREDYRLPEDNLLTGSRDNNLSHTDGGGVDNPYYLG